MKLCSLHGYGHLTVKKAQENKAKKTSNKQNAPKEAPYIKTKKTFLKTPVIQSRIFSGLLLWNILVKDLNAADEFGSYTCSWHKTERCSRHAEEQD